MLVWEAWKNFMEHHHTISPRKGRTTRLLFCGLVLAAVALSPFLALAAQRDMHGPVGSGAFGGSVTVLPNGNLIIVDPRYDEGSMLDVGAVYLYNGASGTLISVLKGSTAGDQVGSGDVTILTNGNYSNPKSFVDFLIF